MQIFPNLCALINVLMTFLFIYQQVSALYVTSRTEDLRCYCTIPSCEASNYICKSPYACYKEEERNAVGSLPVSGCILNMQQNQTMCGKGEAYRESNPQSYVTCCTDDMCNYQPARRVVPKAKDDGASLALAPTFPSDQDSADIYFKLAVIAVPITGVVVLVILVIIAFRVLHQEEEQNKQLTETHHQCCHSNQLCKGRGRSKHLSLAKEKGSVMKPSTQCTCIHQISEATYLPHDHNMYKLGETEEISYECIPSSKYSFLTETQCSEVANTICMASRPGIDGGKPSELSCTCTNAQNLNTTNTNRGARTKGSTFLAGIPDIYKHHGKTPLVNASTCISEMR